jgi:ATP-binding cassette subfamily B protein
VRDNILHNRSELSEHDDKEIHEILGLVGLLHVVLALSKGLDTKLGSRSEDTLCRISDTFSRRVYDAEYASLSEGQIMRLMMARVLFRLRTESPSLVILDEPTASLDPKAEAEFFNLLAPYKSRMTIIFITHALRNLAVADKIMLMESGHVVGYGTHNELNASNEMYKSLYNRDVGAK